jgi:hypothetical protein
MDYEDSNRRPPGCGLLVTGFEGTTQKRRSLTCIVRAVWVVASPRVAYLPDAVVAVGVGGCPILATGMLAVTDSSS